MKKNPQYMVIYECAECKRDSGFTEDEKPLCRYCHHETKMREVSKEKITPELMTQRLKDLSSRMMLNMQAAYETMTESDKASFPEGRDPEKEMLLILDKLQKLHDAVNKLELKEPVTAPDKDRES